MCSFLLFEGASCCRERGRETDVGPPGAEFVSPVLLGVALRFGFCHKVIRFPIEVQFDYTVP